METTMTNVLKTEEELIQEFYQLKDGLDDVYQQDLRVILEEDGDELILGFSTTFDGLTYQITTLYRMLEEQNVKLYEKVNPYWFVSRSEKFIGYGKIESPYEAMDIVMNSMRAYEEICTGVDTEKEKTDLERNCTTLRIRYTYRHPESNSVISKVFPIEQVQCGLVLQFLKDLEERGYELLNISSVEEDNLRAENNAWRAKALEIENFLKEEQESIVRSNYKVKENLFFANGKQNAFKTVREKYDEIYGNDDLQLCI